MPGSRRNEAESAWPLIAGAGVPESLLSDFIRPAVRAIPPALARQLRIRRISIAESLGDDAIASRWTSTDQGLEIDLATSGREPHDIALEMLVCAGQALWTELSDSRRQAYWLLLDREISEGITGEIDEDALKEKQALTSSRASAGSERRLERYGCASFAATTAEYVHSLWHDVTVRTGPEFLPARELKRRLELLSGWYPPGRGYRLFPRQGGATR